MADEIELGFAFALGYQLGLADAGECQEPTDCGYDPEADECSVEGCDGPS